MKYSLIVLLSLLSINSYAQTAKTLCYLSFVESKEVSTAEKLSEQLNAYGQNVLVVKNILRPDESPIESLKQFIDKGNKCDGLVISSSAYAHDLNGHNENGELGVQDLAEMACDPKYGPWFDAIKMVVNNTRGSVGHWDPVVHPDDIAPLNFDEQLHKFALPNDKDFDASYGNHKGSATSLKFKKVFRKAIHLGWEDDSYPEFVSEEGAEDHSANMAFPYLLGRISENLYPDNKDLQVNPLEISSVHQADSYAGIISGLLSKDQVGCKLKLNDELIFDAWKTMGLSRGSLFHLSPGNNSKWLEGNSAFLNEKNMHLVNLREIDCLMLNIQRLDAKAVLKTVDRILEMPQIFSYSSKSILNILDELEKMQDTELKKAVVKKLRRNKQFKKFLKARIANEATNIYKKTDYLLITKHMSRNPEKIDEMLENEVIKFYEVIPGEDETYSASNVKGWFKSYLVDRKLLPANFYDKIINSPTVNPHSINAIKYGLYEEVFKNKKVSNEEKIKVLEKLLEIQNHSEDSLDTIIFGLSRLVKENVSLPNIDDYIHIIMNHSAANFTTWKDLVEITEQKEFPALRLEVLNVMMNAYDHKNLLDTDASIGSYILSKYAPVAPNLEEYNKLYSKYSRLSGNKYTDEDILENLILSVINSPLPGDEIFEKFLSLSKQLGDLQGDFEKDFFYNKLFSSLKDVKNKDNVKTIIDHLLSLDYDQAYIEEELVRLLRTGEIDYEKEVIYKRALQNPKINKYTQFHILADMSQHKLANEKELIDLYIGLKVSPVLMKNIFEEVIKDDVSNPWPLLKVVNLTTNIGHNPVGEYLFKQLKKEDGIRLTELQISDLLRDHLDSFENARSSGTEIQSALVAHSLQISDELALKNLREISNKLSNTDKLKLLVNTVAEGVESDSIEAELINTAEELLKNNALNDTYLIRELLYVLDNIDFPEFTNARKIAFAKNFGKEELPKDADLKYVDHYIESLYIDYHLLSRLSFKQSENSQEVYDYYEYLEEKLNSIHQNQNINKLDKTTNEKEFQKTLVEVELNRLKFIENKKQDHNVPNQLNLIQRLDEKDASLNWHELAAIGKYLKLTVYSDEVSLDDYQDELLFIASSKSANSNTLDNVLEASFTYSRKNGHQIISNIKDIVKIVLTHANTDSETLSLLANKLKLNKLDAEQVILWANQIYEHPKLDAKSRESLIGLLGQTNGGQNLLKAIIQDPASTEREVNIAKKSLKKLNNRN